MEPVVDNPNQILLTDQTDGSFARLWDFGNGITSTLPADTAFYPLAGDYTVTLSVAADGGTRVISKVINIAEDAPVDCDSVALALIGGCTKSDSAVWVFAREAAAVAIGPDPLSGQWFSSQAGALLLTV